MRSRAPSPLTARESEVVEQLRIGLPYKLIADQLGISPNTVKGHCSRIFYKLGVNSSREALYLLPVAR